MDEINNIKFPGKVSRENPFTVPGNYFEEFPSKLQSRLKETRPAPANRFIQRWKPYAAAAVLIIVALVAGNIVFRNYSGNAANRFHAQISDMVETELYSINEETIMEAMYPATEETGPSAIKQDEAIDYLLNGDLNEEELLNEL